MGLAISQIPGAFAGEVSGVDLSRPLSPAEVAASDFVMWDNRQTMHRVRRYSEAHPRDMRRTTVAGDAPTVAPAPAA